MKRRKKNKKNFKITATDATEQKPPCVLHSHTHILYINVYECVCKDTVYHTVKNGKKIMEIHRLSTARHYIKEV